MFRIKICGITEVQDALMCVQAGADALGLNFCSSSPRCITVGRAAEICAQLPSSTVRIGVFVNSPIEWVGELADQLNLDWVQLHGDESPDCIVRLAPRRVLRAFRENQPGFSAAIAYLEQCQRQNALPAAVLVDAYHAAGYGGTGKTINWISVSGFTSRVAPLPLVLAGGLRPSNVAEAISIARPDAVDTASGVESSPGRKDRELVHAFVQAAERAFARHHRRPEFVPPH